MHRSVPLVAAALISLATALPAHAVAAEPAPAKGLFLTLSGAEGAWMRGVRLNCAPQPDGPHPEAAAACEALAAAGGDPDKLQGDPHPCTKRFDPVTVGATGSYQGRATAWNKTYANACELDAATGAVFRF
ncbi:SSI family serine proteinase inhibitor [Streptomyces sp. NPDC020681]|uniref:SSI family serine proteinase inhibitor n=1 Tax=Streptomyces sp. NPDC020681 TaxID=3365083 RepID=UPI0037B067F0